MAGYKALDTAMIQMGHLAHARLLSNNRRPALEFLVSALFHGAVLEKDKDLQTFGPTCRSLLSY